jgi:hypothetical protein
LTERFIAVRIAATSHNMSIDVIERRARGRDISQIVRRYSGSEKL